MSTVVDIGANRGQFALATRKQWPHAKIISFEPLAGAAAKYGAIFADDPLVTLHQCAIGPNSGEAVIHLSAKEDSSSLLPISNLQDMLFPGTAEVGVERCRVARLCDCVTEHALTQPALLKLDVQGFELEALTGCDELLDRFDWIYVECSFVELYSGQALADGVVAWLRNRQFLMKGIHNIHYDSSGAAIQADFLFRNSRSRKNEASSGLS